jgi:hypothetical protein
MPGMAGALQRQQAPGGTQSPWSKTKAEGCSRGRGSGQHSGQRGPLVARYLCHDSVVVSGACAWAAGCARRCGEGRAPPLSMDPGAVAAGLAAARAAAGAAAGGGM